MSFSELSGISVFTSSNYRNPLGKSNNFSSVILMRFPHFLFEFDFQIGLMSFSPQWTYGDQKWELSKLLFKSLDFSGDTELLKVYLSKAKVTSWSFSGLWSSKLFCL